MCDASTGATGLERKDAREDTNKRVCCFGTLPVAVYVGVSGICNASARQWKVLAQKRPAEEARHGRGLVLEKLGGLGSLRRARAAREVEEYERGHGAGPQGTREVNFCDPAGKRQVQIFLLSGSPLDVQVSVKAASASILWSPCLLPGSSGASCSMRFWTTRP